MLMFLYIYFDRKLKIFWLWTQTEICFKTSSVHFLTFWTKNRGIQKIIDNENNYWLQLYETLHNITYKQKNRSVKKTYETCINVDHSPPKTSSLNFNWTSSARPSQRLSVLRSSWDGEDAGRPSVGQRVQQRQQEGGVLHEEGSRLPQQVGGRVGAPAEASVRAGETTNAPEHTWGLCAAPCWLHADNRHLSIPVFILEIRKQKSTFSAWWRL